MRSARCKHLLLLGGCLGWLCACSATPIQLPGSEDKGQDDAAPTARDDAGRAADGQVGLPDTSVNPGGDAGPGADALIPTGDGGLEDATTDGTDRDGGPDDATGGDGTMDGQADGQADGDTDGATGGDATGDDATAIDALPQDGEA